MFPNVAANYQEYQLIWNQSYNAFLSENDF